MTTMYLHITWSGSWDFEGDYTDPHQPVPVMVHAMAGEHEVRAHIAPEAGWSLTRIERENLRRLGVRSIGPLILITDMIKVSDLLVVHGFQATDWMMKRWRSLVGRDPHWLRKIEVFDTAHEATRICKLPLNDGLGLEGVYRTPSLVEAADIICGNKVADEDIDTLVWLHDSLRVRDAA